MHYLLGLRKYTLGNRSDRDLNEAIQSFIKSVSCSTQQINDLSKKTFLKLNHILMLYYDITHERFSQT